jgi:hypothetical protein
MNPPAPWGFVSNVPLFDFVIRGGIIKRAFPQHPPEIPRFFPVDEIPHGKRHRRTVFPVAGDFQQLTQSAFVQFDRHSHVNKMMFLSSFVNVKIIISF